MSKVDEAIVEIDATLAEMAPRHEGFRDFDRLNIKPETKVEVEAMIEIYDRRTAKLNAARAALVDLVADGHPTLDARPVEALVLADLDEQNATIDAARTQFVQAMATTLNTSVGSAELKG